MGEKRSFNDAFAPRKPQGTDGFARAKTPDAPKTPAAKSPPADAFKPAPKPSKPEISAKAAKPKPPKDAFARKAPTPAKVEAPRPVKAETLKPAKVKPEAKMQRPPPPPKVVAPKPEIALKPVQQGGAKLPPLVRSAEPPPAKIPPLVAQPMAAKQPAMVRAEPTPKPRNLFGRSGGEPKARQRALTPSAAPRASGMTSPPKRDGGKVPAMAFAAALPKPHGGAGYNPFDRRRFVKSPTPPPEAPLMEEAIAAPASAPAPDPFFDLPPEREPAPVELSSPAPEVRRAPLHVVPTAATVDAVSKPKPAKTAGAARSSSLVLVSGAGAVAAAEAADAPEAAPAEKPAEAAPASPAAPAAAAAEPAAKAQKAKRGRGGGGAGDGGGSGGTRSPARAVAHRGFNQDDMFGVLFGIAVLAFLLMWFMRGKTEEAEDGTLFAAQSAPVQRLAVSPTPPLPAPLPPADPFGQGPVDLKPQGPVLEALPPPAESAEVAPATPPPAVAAKPAPAVESALPLAERKMHAWFCTASSRLTKTARTDLGGELDKFAQVFAGKELVVRGYADTRGSLESNTELGGNRANVVADFLRTKGLTVVDVQGVGELDGLDDNQNCANQRRVDVWVKGGPAETPSRACAPQPDVEALVCG